MDFPSLLETVPLTLMTEAPDPLFFTNIPFFPRISPVVIETLPELLTFSRPCATYSAVSVEEVITPDTLIEVCPSSE